MSARCFICICAATCATRSGAAEGLSRRGKIHRRRVLELLEIFQLGKFRDEPAKSLSYGDQRRLEIVRALAAQPKLLLLDEPAAGMNANEKLELMRLIRSSRTNFRFPFARRT
jgi:branched-chain amino acid transport system ATP-binding protein